MDEFDSCSDPSAVSSGGSFPSREVAHYIHQMAAELSAMADASGLFRLAAGLRVIAAISAAELGDRGQS